MTSPQDPGRGNASGVLRTALAYAASGWAVFSVHGVSVAGCDCGASDCSSPGKHPLTRRGVKDATTEAAVVVGWWRRWPRANVALATGTASGIVVVDIDPPQGDDSLDSLVDAGYELPETIAARTGSGGLHLYYAAPDFSMGNTAGRLPGIELELPGIDLRADGGYVVAPPSLHASGSSYEWLKVEVEIAPLPSWLRPAEGTPVQEPAPVRVAPGSSSPYGLAALEGELKELRGAPEGTRNHTLNRCAFRLGRLIGGGELSEVEVVAALRTEAQSRGLTPGEVERTIASGVGAGRRHPRRNPGSCGRISPL